MDFGYDIWLALVVEGDACPKVIDIVKKLVAWNDPRKGNLMQASMSVWKQLHRVVVAAQCPQIVFAQKVALPAPSGQASKKKAKTAAPKPQTSVPKRPECEVAGSY